MNILLASATFVVREIHAVGNDDMIHETDAHHLASLSDVLGQVVVCLTGT